MIIENGVLLREYRQGAYFKSDGYLSFDAAITDMQQKGILDYGPRNARNFIAIIDLIESQLLDTDTVESLGISKLREIASLNSEQDQVNLLAEAGDLSVSDVQKEARRLRDKAAGREVDPLEPVTLQLTATQAAFYRHCLVEGRRVYGIEDAVPDAAVLVDAVLADWFSGIDQIEAEAVQASQ